MMTNFLQFSFIIGLVMIFYVTFRLLWDAKPNHAQLRPYYWSGLVIILGSLFLLDITQ